MKEIIDLLRSWHLRVTIYDRGEDAVDFVLAVAIDEPIDIWFIARGLPATFPRAPTVEGKLMVFHDLKIDAEMYEYICAAD